MENPILRSSKTEVTRADLLALFPFAKQLGTRRLPSFLHSHSTHMGQHASHLRGRGMEYQESRLYDVGDDIRHLDWRLSAKTGKTYSKVFSEEKSRPTYFLLCCSDSMQFASQGTFKSVLAARLATLLAWLVMQQHDSVGVASYGMKGVHASKALSGRIGVMRLIEHLVRAYQTPEAVKSRSDTQTEPSLSDGLRQLSSVLRPGSLLLIFSDAQQLGDCCQQLLHQLRAHHSVMHFMIHDALECHLPTQKTANFPVWHEQQLQFLSTSAMDRQRYTDQQQQRYYDFEQLLLGAGIINIPVQTCVELASHLGLMHYLSNLDHRGYSRDLSRDSNDNRGNRSNSRAGQAMDQNGH